MTCPEIDVSSARFMKGRSHQWPHMTHCVISFEQKRSLRLKSDWLPSAHLHSFEGHHWPITLTFWNCHGLSIRICPRPMADDSAATSRADNPFQADPPQMTMTNTDRMARIVAAGRQLPNRRSSASKRYGGFAAVLQGPPCQGLVDGEVRVGHRAGSQRQPPLHRIPGQLGFASPAR